MVFRVGSASVKRINNILQVYYFFVPIPNTGFLTLPLSINLIHDIVLCESSDCVVIPSPPGYG